MSRSIEQLQIKQLQRTEGINIKNLIAWFNNFSNKEKGSLEGTIPHALEKEFMALADNGFTITKESIANIIEKGTVFLSK